MPTATYQTLRNLIQREPSLHGFGTGRHRRIASGFSTSHAMELCRR